MENKELKMVTRYQAWHITEPGYKSAKDAQEWIDRQDNPEDYFVVASQVPKKRVDYVKSLFKRLGGKNG